jgi:hypothetical protein
MKSIASRVPRKTTLLFGFACMWFAIAPLFAADTSFDPVRPEIISGRLSGFGGAYSALEAGFDTLSTNPAALAYVSSEWSIARLAARVSGPLFDLPSVAQSDDMTNSLLDLVSSNNGVYIGANVTGPLAFGKVDQNFGFGVFNRTITTVDIPSITSADLYVGEEFLLTGAYGLTVFEKGSQSISVGLQMKGYFQTFVFESGTAISIVSSLTDGLSVNSLPTALSTGFGIDAGILYRAGQHLNVGITCKDLYTPVFTTTYSGFSDFMNGSSASTTTIDRLDPYLSVGIVYDIPLPDNWLTVSSWKVMTDYRDILDLLNPLYRNPILNIAGGTEVILLDIVSLRAGISDSYLSTGIGLDLTVFQIDAAMYGSELGLEPGKRPLLNMVLSLSFQY